MPNFQAMMHKVRSIIAALAGLGLPFTPVFAETAPEPVVKAELIDGWRTASGSEMVAMRLVLAPGWKTYWRAPGEAGIPPRFDWSGSTNLASVAFHWPKPEMFDLNGLRTFGYHDMLVLPIEITARDPGAPIALRAAVELGVCEDICVPVSLSLTGSIVPGGAAVPEIRSALDNQPEAARAAGLSAAHCEAEPIRDGMRLTGRLTLPPVGPEEIAVLELADKSVWVSPAETSRTGGELRTTADLVPASAQPFAVNRSDIRITVFGSTGRAVELQGCAG
ncbi:MAG: protein-disulfide reductase DsbD domain-containing protein [Albidovulum sp.]